MPSLWRASPGRVPWMAGSSPAMTTYSGRRQLMIKTKQSLRVVVQDLVGVGLWQSQPLDIGEGLLVFFVILQDRVVAAGYQVIGAEGFEGASERGLRAIAHGVVPELLRVTLGASARLGWPLWLRPCLSRRLSSIGIGPPRCGTMNLMFGWGWGICLAIMCNTKVAPSSEVPTAARQP